MFDQSLSDADVEISHRFPGRCAIIMLIKKAGETGEWLRLYNALTQDLSLALTTHKGQLTTTCISSFRDPILLWAPWATANAHTV